MTISEFILQPSHPVVLYPSEILRRVCRPVEINDDIAKVCRIMLDIMYARNGCGLAAPQVGLDVRIFVANPSATRDPGKEWAFINPEIIFSSTHTSSSTEGCLSLPGCVGMVERPRKIILTACDTTGRKNKYAFEGLMGRIVQHEFDHLDGRLILDKVVNAETLWAAALEKLKCHQINEQAGA